MVVFSGTQYLSIPEDAAVSGLQATGTNAAGEAAQVKHSGSYTHHQLCREDGLQAAPTAYCKQTGGGEVGENNTGLLTAGCDAFGVPDMKHEHLRTHVSVKLYSIR